MKLVWHLLVLQGWLLQSCALAIQHSSQSPSPEGVLGGRPGAILFEVYESLTGSQPMPTVNHDKEPGNGYIPGSPLYDKQEALKSDSGAEAPAADPSTPGSECKNNFWFGWCMITKYPKSYFVNLLVQIVLFLLVAYLYKTYKPRFYTPNKVVAPQSGWAYGLFSCHDCRPDISICCMSFCCMGIRWADTLSSWKVMPGTYWQAIALLLILQILAPFTSGISLLIMLGFMVYARQRIRGVFGHSPGTCFTVCTDCLTWWCCACCATVQEAREVEKVMITSSTAVPPQYTFASQGGSRDGLPSSIATMPPTGVQVPTAGSSGQYPTLPQSGVQPFGSSMSSQGAAAK